MASTALYSEVSELLLSMMISVQNDEKFEPAKVRKNGEIGEEEEENNKICVFLDKTVPNISVFLDVKYGLCQKVRKIAPR